MRVTILRIGLVNCFQCITVYCGCLYRQTLFSGCEDVIGTSYLTAATWSGANHAPRGGVPRSICFNLLSALLLPFFIRKKEDAFGRPPYPDEFKRPSNNTSIPPARSTDNLLNYVIPRIYISTRRFRFNVLTDRHGLNLKIEYRRRSGECACELIISRLSFTKNHLIE